MADGVIIKNGIVAAHVYGFAGQPEPGATFIATTDPSKFEPGQPAPSPAQAAIPDTDPGMARVTEDLVAALIAKGVIAGADIPAAALAKVNARRALRGLPHL